MFFVPDQGSPGTYLDVGYASNSGFQRLTGMAVFSVGHSSTQRHSLFNSSWLNAILFPSPLICLDASLQAYACVVTLASVTTVFRETMNILPSICIRRQLQAGARMWTQALLYQCTSECPPQMRLLDVRSSTWHCSWMLVDHMCATWLDVRSPISLRYHAVCMRCHIHSCMRILDKCCLAITIFSIYFFRKVTVHVSSDAYSWSATTLVGKL